MAETKQDRELIELLNELRVALPGVQVLFAFLLVVPFSEGFDKVTSAQKGVYFAAFLFTALATAFLIAPTSYHRLRWRARDKEQMLITSNRLTIAGTLSLALAIGCVVYFITDFLYSNLSAIVTAIIGVILVALWYGLPIARGFQQDR